ncbi:MAG: sugar phosphate isomerase/epimerase [Bryobacteraceae bacterium]|nr:sugar phosphate isomerase/epimerase [Bryobacteraceae bacterium]
MDRRTFLAAPAAFAAPSDPAPAQRWPVVAFSKHFQWTSVAEAAAHCAELGYDGLDLTVRPGGHVEPARVTEDLPKAVEQIRSQKLAMPMVTAGIVDATTPHAEAVLRALVAAKIPRYRWGGFRYVEGKSIPAQLDELRPKVRDLAAMNRQFGLTAMYHTHSGPTQVGASMWDLYLLLKDQSPDAVSVNYDIGHAVVEGGYGNWTHTTRLLMPFTRGIAIKDFLWSKNAKGAWVPEWCAFGEGMVDFRRFLTMAKAAGFTGPLQQHFEYPGLGGADSGKAVLTIPKEKLLAEFRRDLNKLKRLLKEVGMA